MSQKPIIPSIIESSKFEKTKKPKKNNNSGYIDFLKEKIKVRIFFPSNECKEYSMKVTAHVFEIDECAYFIHSDAFYRVGKIWFCDYFYNNPKPIVHKYNDKGILVASDELVRDFKERSVIDLDGKPVSYSDWVGLNYNQKVLFDGVVEFDSKMINKALNHKFVNNLWGKDDSSLFDRGGKWWLIGIVIMVALVITFFIMKANGLIGGEV